MKKLLLLSVLCVFAQVKTEERKILEIELPGGRTMTLKDFKNLLQKTTSAQIQDDIKRTIDPATGQFVTIEDAEPLNLKVSSLGHGCQQIINILDLHDGKWINLNPVTKEELEQFLPLCSDFYSNTKEAITNSPLIDSQRDIMVQGLTKFQSKAIELMQNK